MKWGADKCIHCGSYDFENVKRQEADGHWVLFRLCTGCQRMWDSKFLQKEKLPGWERLRQVAGEPLAICSRCGTAGAQWHHFFPVAMAKAAVTNPETWPKALLCDDCHIAAHKNLTPGLVDPHWKGAKHGQF